jgi:hypothetical protein
MAEVKLSDSIDSQMGLDILQQIRLCEDIDDVKNLMTDFLPEKADLQQIKLFKWIESRSCNEKTIQNCIRNKDMTGLKEIIKFHIDLLKAKVDQLKANEMNLEEILAKLVELDYRHFEFFQVGLVSMNLSDEILQSFNKLSLNDVTIEACMKKGDMFKITTIMKFHLALMEGPPYKKDILDKLCGLVYIQITKTSLIEIGLIISELLKKYKVEYEQFKAWYESQLKIDKKLSYDERPIRPLAKIELLDIHFNEKLIL